VRRSALSLGEPLKRVEEFWAAIGRRGGKSRAIALLVVYVALLVDHSASLLVGERGVVLVLAQNVRQRGWCSATSLA
jgi:hypothetical protein